MHYSGHEKVHKHKLQRAQSARREPKLDRGTLSRPPGVHTRARVQPERAFARVGRLARSILQRVSDQFESVQVHAHRRQALVLAVSRRYVGQSAQCQLFQRQSMVGHRNQTRHDAHISHQSAWWAGERAHALETVRGQSCVQASTHGWVHRPRGHFKSERVHAFQRSDGRSATATAAHDATTVR